MYAPCSHPPYSRRPARFRAFRNPAALTLLLTGAVLALTLLGIAPRPAAALEECRLMRMPESRLEQELARSI